MKSWLIVFVLLAFCVPTWGQSAANHFHFVSSIYAPNGSFGEVVTQPNDGTTKIKSGVNFNIGSKQSAEGTIEIKGNPLDIKELKMKNETAISSNTHWFMNTLTLGKNAKVNVKTLIANTVTLENGSSEANKETGLKVNEALLIENNTYTQQGRAAHELEAKATGFHFIQANGTLDDQIEKEATWKKLGLKRNNGENEEQDSVAKYNELYPIRSN